MNEHDTYMQDFMRVYETLECWGPGSQEDTAKAFKLLKIDPKRILEVGCGNGNSTIELAKLSDAEIVATDNEQSALTRLDEKLELYGLNNKVKTQCLSMTDLTFDNERFDVIWAEGSAYIMGVENALEQWKKLLNENGILVFSDMVWLMDSPSEDSIAHWKNDYPDMQSVDVRVEQIERAGYKLERTFTLSEKAWKNYYAPLKDRLNKLRPLMKNSQAINDIQKEVELSESRSGEFGYQFFIVKKR